MQQAFQSSGPIGERVERIRRSGRFKKVPSTSFVLRLLIESALDRWEQEDRAAPGPAEEAHP